MVGDGLEQLENGVSRGSDYVANIPSYRFESGRTAFNLKVRYHTYGVLSSNRDNMIIVGHTLTGNCHVHTWWPSMFSSENNLAAPFDDSTHFIVSVTLLGSPYNPSSPATIKTEKEFQESFFHNISLRDQARLQLDIITKKFSPNKITAVVGASLGGMLAMQLYEGAMARSLLVGKLIVCACGPVLHPWQRAFSYLQKQVILQSKSLEEGLKLARAIALVTYRSHQSYEAKFMDHTEEIYSYFSHQSNSFGHRFDAFSYIALVESMNTHDVRDAIHLQDAETLLISLSTDILYPSKEQVDIKKVIPSAKHITIETEHGHHGFLLEQETIAAICYAFLQGNEALTPY